MTAADLANIISGVAPVVREYVAGAIGSFGDRLQAIEQRMAGVRDGKDGEPGPAGERGADGAAGRDGKDAESVNLEAIVARAAALIEPGADGTDGAPGEKGQDGAAGRDGIDGKDAEPVDIEAIVQRVAVLVPAGKDGDRGLDGHPGRNGVDGKDAEPITREALIDAVLSLPDALQAAVAKHLEINPPLAGRDGIDGRHGVDGVNGNHGIDGKDGAPGADGRDGIDGLHGKDGADGIHGVDGNNGVGLAGAVLARDGSLVVTLSDGATKELGVIVGTDGAPGPAGRDGINGIDGIHGKDGSDGKDGMGFDDMVVEHDGDRGIVVKLIQGERIKTFGPFVFPVIVYKGVWKAGETYQQGEVVTWGGSMWHANKSTSAKPGDGGGDWTLSVKKGSDGSGGKSGPQGERGPRGDAGPMGPARYS